MAKKNREQAKAIRDAAMGNAKRDDINELSDADNGSETMKNEAEDISESLELAGLVGCAKQLLSPDSSESDQVEHRNGRLDTQERKLKLEEDEMKLKKDNRLQEIEDRKLDGEERKRMMENTSKKQEALPSVVQKLAEK